MRRLVSLLLCIVSCQAIADTSAPASSPDGSTLPSASDHSRPLYDPVTGALLSLPDKRENTTETNRNDLVPSGSDRSPNRVETTRSPTHYQAPPAPQSDSSLRNNSLLSQPMPSKPEVNHLAPNYSDSFIIPNEMVVQAFSLEEANEQLTFLKSHAFRIKHRRVLKQLGLVVSVFSYPEHLGYEEAETLVQQQINLDQIEPNKGYRLLSAAPIEYARESIHAPSIPTQSGHTVLAQLDTGIYPQHPSLINAHITSHRISKGQPASSSHGTSVASLIVGQKHPLGALPQAHLYAVDVFHIDREGQLQALLLDWVSALDWLAGQSPAPSVVNMSFGGLPSALLSHVFKKLSNQMVFVAAAGNSGPNSQVMYPASDPFVLAVTAIDVKQRLYRGAPISPHIRFAAPGVDVWVAEGQKGGGYRSGTSFAAPLVSAVIADAIARKHSLKQVIQSSQDLGQKGQDNRFGHGLINFLQKK